MHERQGPDSALFLAGNFPFIYELIPRCFYPFACLENCDLESTTHHEGCEVETGARCAGCGVGYAFLPLID
jgi:hypothetical protein